MPTITALPMFDPNQVDNAAPETLYTVPSTGAYASAFLRDAVVRFVNTTAGAVTIKVWAVPSGGSTSDTNTCVSTRSIAANDHYDAYIPMISAGGTIRAQAGAGTSISAFAMKGNLQY